MVIFCCASFLDRGSSCADPAGLGDCMPGFQASSPHSPQPTRGRTPPGVNISSSIHTWAHKVAHAAGRGPFAASQEWVDLYRRLLVFVLCRIVSRRVGSCPVLSCPNWGAAALATDAVCVCMCVCGRACWPKCGCEEIIDPRSSPHLGSSSWTLTSYHRLQGV